MEIYGIDRATFGDLCSLGSLVLGPKQGGMSFKWARANVTIFKGPCIISVGGLWGLFSLGLEQGESCLLKRHVQAYLFSKGCLYSFH